MSERFKVYWVDEVRELYPGLLEDFGFSDYALCYCLIDTQTKTLVGHDGGEPEDKLLVRDFRWVVAALNKLDASYKKEKEESK